MKTIFALILGSLSFASILYLAFERAPKTKTEIIRETVFLTETRTRTIEKELVVGNEKLQVDIEVPYTVQVPSTVSRVQTTTPTSLQKLQFWFILAVGVFFGVYVLFVLVLWGRAKLQQTRASADIRDTQARLDSVIKMASGILLGFLGTVNVAAPITNPANKPDDTVTNSDAPPKLTGGATEPEREHQ